MDLFFNNKPGRFMSFNIYGDLENKLLLEDFTKSLKEHDIILLSETWTSKSSCLELEGYTCFSKHRDRKLKSRRSSGGLVCYARHDISKGVTLLDWNWEDGLCLRLDKDFSVLMKICLYFLFI